MNNKQIEDCYLELRKVQNDQCYIRGKKVLESIKYFKKFKLIKSMKNFLGAFHYNKPNIYDKENESIVCNQCDISEPKICVFTCITGNYDNVSEPFATFQNVDYVLFTNCDIKSTNWKKVNIPEKISNMDNILINRYIKMHPFEFLKGYDYYIYVDGNVVIVSDIRNLINNLKLDYGVAFHSHVLRNCIYDEINACIKFKKGNKNRLLEQKEKYLKEKFPKDYGLLEATVIVSKENTISKEFFDSWWDNFINSKSYRDQIALPYTLWKMDLKTSEISTLGNNVYMNRYFYVKVH